MKQYALYFSLLLLATSCFEQPAASGEKIAEANGKILYREDVKDILPAGLPPADSLQLLHRYVNSWARKQLVAQMAERYLSKDLKDVTQELEDYRLSLLIYRYEKMHLEQGLDTVVSEREISALYNAAPQNFILTKPVAKAVYIKILTNASQTKRIKQIYRSLKPADREELSSLSSTAAVTYTNFDNKWITADLLTSELPLSLVQIEEKWTNGYIEVEEREYTYLICLQEMTAIGEQAPVEYEREKITAIIRNRRRQALLKNLENTIYNDALNRNKLKIYIDK